MSSIICSICARAKDISHYSTSKQRHVKACDDCYKNRAHHARGLCSETTKPAYKFKMVKCLRCSRTFKGGTSIRICPHCKNTSEYQEALWSSSLGGIQ